MLVDELVGEIQELKNPSHTRDFKPYIAFNYCTHSTCSCPLHSPNSSLYTTQPFHLQPHLPDPLSSPSTGVDGVDWISSAVIANLSALAMSIAASGETAALSFFWKLVSVLTFSRNALSYSSDMVVREGCWSRSKGIWYLFNWYSINSVLTGIPYEYILKAKNMC